MTAEKTYIVKKKSDTEVNIFKKGNKGYTNYCYKLVTIPDINLHTWKMDHVHVSDASFADLYEVSNSGADQEGVLKIEGEADYIGGVHGDEQYTDMVLFIDGAETTLSEMNATVYCDEIKFCVASDIFHANASCEDDPVFKKTKMTTFDKDGVHVQNTWVPQEVVTLTHVRGILLSVSKSVITRYFDSHVERFPLAVPAVSSVTSRLIANADMTDMHFYGLIRARNWCGERGGDPSMYRAYLADFGSRLKSYFDSYTGYTTTIGEKIYCENNFLIEY